MNRAYVKTVKKHLIPTPTGELVVDSLVGKFEFIDLGFTRDAEENLDRIALGKAAYKSVIATIHDKLKAELSGLHASTTPKHACPDCAKALRRIQGKKGFFWGCTGYPECTTSLPDNDGKPGARPAQQTSNHACMQCGKPLVHRLKKGKGGFDFWGCSGFKDGCKTSYKNNNGAPVF